MPRNRRSWRMEDFRGENNIDNLTDQDIFGRRRGAQLYRARGYHWIGQGRARKRYGYQRYATPNVAGSNAGQGIVMRRVGNTRQLVAVMNGQVKVFDESGDSFDEITAGTVTGGKNVLSTWGNFNDGTNRWLLHANANDEPWLWDGNTANNIQQISSLDGTAPTEGVGFINFHGYPMILTENDLHYGAYGRMDNWAGGGKIDAARGTPGFALHKHSRDVVLIFYEDEIFRIEFNPHEGSTFRARAVDESEPCVSRPSIVTKDGATYYAAERGIHQLKNPSGPSKFVGRRIQAFWDSLNRSRKSSITAINRGEPWNEVMWLVSHGTSEQHNAVIIYNTQLDSWSIFPVAETSGKMEFNVGTNFIDTNGIPRTITLGYDGGMWEAWGHAFADSGYTDDGTNVKTEFGLGFVDFGYPGVSYVRQMILDIETSTSKSFTLTMEPMGKNPIVKTFTAGAGGALLDVSFTLDESILSLSTVSQAQQKIVADSRYFQASLTESDTDVPHVISAIDFPHKHGGMRMVA